MQLDVDAQIWIVSGYADAVISFREHATRCICVLESERKIGHQGVADRSLVLPFLSSLSYLALLFLFLFMLFRFLFSCFYRYFASLKPFSGVSRYIKQLSRNAAQ